MRNGRNFAGVQIPPEAMPKDEYWHVTSWARGLDSSDAPEDTGEDAAPEMQDMEVTRDDRLVRAPGIFLCEDLPHVPEEILVQAGSKYESEIVFLAPPYIGFRRDAQSSWDSVGLRAGPWAHTNYAGVLLLTNGQKGIYFREFGKNVIDLIDEAPAGTALTVFAGRILVGGAKLDSGVVDSMGVAWSGDPSKEGVLPYKNWDVEFGAASQVLIGSRPVADKIQGFAPLGFDTLAVICRRSIWQGVPTGDVFQPISFSPRLEGIGCTHRRTIVPTEFGVLFLGGDGVRLFTGTDAPIVSEPINPQIFPIDEDQAFTASFDPDLRRYYLHAPDATWVFDMLKRRWFKWTNAFNQSIYMPAQGTRGPTWGEVEGTWGEQTLAWWQFHTQESGGQQYFLRDAKLGVATTDEFNVFDEPLKPEWFPGTLVGENQDQLMTALSSRFTYEAEFDSDIALWLPDKPNGNYEFVTNATLRGGPKTRRITVPYIHTGRGLGLGIKILSGYPRIRRADIQFQRTSLLFEDFEPAQPPPPQELTATIQFVKRVVTAIGTPAVPSGFGITSTAGAITWDAGVPDGADTIKYTSAPITVAPGTYTLHESLASGYATSGWSVVGAAGAVNSNYNTGSVVVAAGESVVATITNSKIVATLQLVKRIINTEGGTATLEDFGITTNAGELEWDEGVPDGPATKYTSTPITVLPGTYTLHEDAVDGYHAGSWSVVGAAGDVDDDPQDGSVEIAGGETVVATIINDDCIPAMVYDQDYDAGTLGEAITAFNADWPAFEATGGLSPMEEQPSGVLSDPAPVGTRFVGHTAIAGGSAAYSGGGTYGRARALHRRVITEDEDSNPLQPNTLYKVQLWMNLGWLQSSEIGHHPGAHTVSCGAMADGGEQKIISLWCWYAVGNTYYEPSGSEDPDIPLKNTLKIIDHNTTQFARELFPELDGWQLYEFFAQTNGSGELGLTFGRFDTANYAGGSGYRLRVTTICPGDVDGADVEPDPQVTKINITQAGIETAFNAPVAEARVSQMGIEWAVEL